MKFLPISHLHFFRTNIDRYEKNALTKYLSLSLQSPISIPTIVAKEKKEEEEEEEEEETERLTAKDREILDFRRWCIDREEQLPGVFESNGPTNDISSISTE